MTTSPRLGEELLVLARRHPRSGWETSPALGELGRFWLQRHAMFRRLDVLIREATEAALDGSTDPARFRPWLARHLRFGLGQLEEHHLVEDHHYFPLFRAAEPRLVAGFELLERDHDQIHAAIAGLVEHAGPLLTGAAPDPAGLARFHDAHLAHGRLLLRHLDDEEDLVIPLLLERGEDRLGGG